MLIENQREDMKTFDASMMGSPGVGLSDYKRKRLFRRFLIKHESCELFELKAQPCEAKIPKQSKL